MIRVIISGGGTGGHIYPAIAIANALKAQQPNTQILFVGALGKMEMEKVPKAGYQIEGLPIQGLQRSLSLENLQFPFKLLKSLLLARKIIANFKPDIAIGVGGFASGPLLYMASRAGVPTLIQEQNSFAGITNKLLAKKASAICVAYNGMERFFPKNKIIFTGNPVRSDILEIESKKTAALAKFGLNSSQKVLFVMGGSLGAKSINLSIAAGIDTILHAGYQLIWQTGKPFYQTAHNVAAGKQGVYVSDFIYDMDLAYAAATVVVSRAGALSVSELCLAAKPAILVPYPFAAEDHQTANAQALVSAQAAIMVADSQTDTQLVTKALQLLQNEIEQSLFQKNIAMLAKPKAATEIANKVFEIVKNKKYEH
jgi:UDP-N-acetylglucosamine--N-acetylmuramyl-(pentapeptide) pyrophosphoryl-undecaprenol N-acetylglucosamine transferase